MVYFRLFLMPMLVLSLLVHVQSTTASKSNKTRNGPKSAPKLRLHPLTRSDLISTSGSPSKSGKTRPPGSKLKNSRTQMSALTLTLCPETPTLEHEITVEVIGDSGTETSIGVGSEGDSPYAVEVGQSYPQKTIREIKMTGQESQVVCVQTLVVDVTIMIDQPTEFKQTCPETPEVDDLPCRQFGDSVLTPFVCPAKLTELLQSKDQISSEPEEMPTDYTPPVYDITNDMLQASGAIADGLTEGFGTIVKNRIKAHKAAIKSKPISQIASVMNSVGSFIGTLGPIFSIFSGITSIVTNFLTPNPFDELAKYMDKQFDLVHEEIRGVQADIADLARLLEAQGSVLAMADQIRAIRYAVRNYGSMVERLSSEPVCGKSSLLNLREVDVFLSQYADDRVDNSLIDLYEVDFGGVTEAGQGLLKPYAKAYCNSHPENLGKFANELSFYGYAGTMAHFAYRNLDCLQRGNEDCDESEEERTEWVTRLHKFLKKAQVFKVATYNLPASLYLDVRDELEKLIDDEVQKVRKTRTSQPIPGLLDKVYTLIVDKVTDGNDWSNQCILKMHGDEFTKVIEVAEVSGLQFFDYNDHLNVPWHKSLKRKRFYVEKQNTDNNYKTQRIKCTEQEGGAEPKCRSGAYIPANFPKDIVLFVMYNPEIYQSYYEYTNFIPKPIETVFISYRDVYAYYDNDGDSGMEGDVGVFCWSDHWNGCGTSYETQFALIKNNQETKKSNNDH